MKKTILLNIALAALFPSAAVAEPVRPNILVILADDLGWSDIGAFGGEIRTPHLDSLAAGGTKFTQFYNTARCCPSRASLLTGLYPHQAGIGHMLWPTGYPGYSTRLTSDSVTIAEVLHDSGYGTYMTGKWHMAEREPDPADPTGWPLQRGFDKFYGTLAGYGSFYDPATLCRGNTYITPENDPEYKTDNFYYTDAISDNAVGFIKEHKEGDADKPFFMYVAYTAAHWPLHVPEDSLAEYRGKYDVGYDAIRDKRIERLRELGLISNVGAVAPTTGDWNAVEDKAWEARRMEAYAAMITRMDAGIGKIIDHLKETGQLENTLVLYIQDNGGCDEEFFHNNHKKPDNVHVMGPNELQTRTLPPMQTRDGRVVKTGAGVMAGPDDSFLGYGPAWANVSNTPLRLVKKNAHEGGISTPLIVHLPASMKSAGSKVVSTAGHLIDIMPTILEVSKAQYPTERDGIKILPMEGKSLVPLLTGAGLFTRNEPLFWEHEENRAVRWGKWKLVAEANKPWELYDMEADRAEMNNVAISNYGGVSKMISEWQNYAERAKVQPLGAHRLRTRTPDPENAPRRLELETGDVYAREYAPALSDAGVSITAHISKLAPQGVIVAQGAEAHGYALYLKDGYAHFVVRRERELLDVTSGHIAAEGPVTISARLERNGTATIKVNDSAEKTKQFYGPLLETPTEALTVGWDQGGPVGDYPQSFSFQGMISKVELETLHK